MERVDGENIGAVIRGSSSVGLLLVELGAWACFGL